MTLEQFKARVAKAENEMDLDELCWKWLGAAAADNGKEGRVAQGLMELIQRELMP